MCLGKGLGVAETSNSPFAALFVQCVLDIHFGGAIALNRRRFELKKTVLTLMMAAALGMAGTASAVSYDANLTHGVIMGDGIGTGSWTVDQNSGVELGLRAKLRHNAIGNPENTYNSNGDGTYSFAAGVAPTQSAPTGVWSFEWSINTDFDGTSGFDLDELTYELGLDKDAGAGTDFEIFDPINDLDPNSAWPFLYWDHSLGNNATTAATDVKATVFNYNTHISNNNVAQNSWKAHWYIPGFDPTLDGVYNIYLSASDSNGLVSRTEIQVIVGAGASAPIPEPATMTLLGLGLAGLGLRARKRNIA